MGKNIREAVLFRVNEVMSNILKLQELDVIDTLVRFHAPTR